MPEILTAIPVFFRPEMVALEASTSSPSAAKPAQVVADWQTQGLPIQVIDFEPIDHDTLALAHERTYVQGVLAGKVPNGFGNRKSQVTASLPFTSGSMLAAARSGDAAQRSDAWATCTGRGAVLTPTRVWRHFGWSSPRRRAMMMQK